jgi:hypothetical protein
VFSYKADAVMGGIPERISYAADTLSDSCTKDASASGGEHRPCMKEKPWQQKMAIKFHTGYISS